MGTKTATGTAQSTPVRAACAALLWEACRRETDVEAVAAAVPGLRAGVAAGFDPEALVRAAVDHGVGQLMWRALTAAGCEDVLGDAGALLDAAAEVHRFEALLLLPRAVAHAVGPLVDAGLEPVVFKGPAVASRYPEPGLRHMEDIDLLLPKRSHRAALTALTRSGWDVVRGAAGDRYDTVLRHPDVSPLVLELHYGLEAWYEKTTRLDAEQLWRRRVEADILGTAAFVLPVEDELVALAAHAGKPFHGFRRLVWIADLAMCVGAAAASSAPVDWDAVHELARRSRCATVVSVALAMAGPIGVDAPASTFVLPSSGWRRAALDALVDPEWPVRYDELPTYHLRFALADTTWRRAVLLAGMVHDTTSWRERAQLSARVVSQAGSRWRALRRTGEVTA